MNSMNVAAFFKNFLPSGFPIADSSTGISAGQTVLLVLGLVGLTIVMRSTYRRVGRSRAQPRTSARERYAGLQQHHEVKSDVENVMLELDQLARQIHGRIDTRFAKLEAIIRDADERIERLSRLTRAAEGAPALDVTLEHEDPYEDRSCDTPDLGGPQAAVYRLADGGLSATDIAQEVGKTTGEVELILALRKTRREAGRPLDPVPFSPPKPTA